MKHDNHEKPNGTSVQHLTVSRNSLTKTSSGNPELDDQLTYTMSFHFGMLHQYITLEIYFVCTVCDIGVCSEYV